ncbi:rhodanese-like domain-containing protein [Arenimonas caeni]|uniref:Rhodanese-like domain-containing protein n=1 Tax=Arenimonas caeni TaxID=2058085 RepID=A0A2P6MA85_9GAMM|nr:rhodanese-like domain-containing protein [Arenimonas caeni]PRH82914.1 rhodanese-like domain-containing protein [Arenimonas caeni]
MRRFVPMFLLAAALAPSLALAGRPAVSPAVVAEILERPDAPLLLDVRTPEEFAKGHLPGAVLIPHDQLASRLAELEGKPWVLIYCRSGRRADAAQEVLEHAGIEVRQIEGSWLRWEAEERPVALPAAEAAR